MQLHVIVKIDSPESMEANSLSNSNFKVLKNMIPSESNGQIISYSTKQEKDTVLEMFK